MLSWFLFSQGLSYIEFSNDGLSYADKINVKSSNNKLSTI